MLSHPVRVFVLLLLVRQALLPRAFFNSTTNRCEPFDWGGCGGVVPFKTVEECRQVCGG